MNFWDPSISPRKAEAVRIHHFKRKVRGTKALKLQQWLQSYRQVLAHYERSKLEYKNPAPHQLAALQAQANVDAIESELAWRRLGTGGPFR